MSIASSSTRTPHDIIGDFQAGAMDAATAAAEIASLCSDEVTRESFLDQLQQTVRFALGVRSGPSTPTRDDSVDTFTMDLGEDAGLDDFVAYLAGANLLSPLQASKIAPAASRYTIKKRSRVDLNAVNTPLAKEGQRPESPSPAPQKRVKADNGTAAPPAPSLLQAVRPATNFKDWMLDCTANGPQPVAIDDPLVASTDFLVRKFRAMTKTDGLQLILSMRDRPPLPEEVWPTIAANKFVDLALLTRSKQPPSNIGEWLSAWFIFKSAALHLFPHRVPEFDAYLTFMSNVHTNKVMASLHRFSAWLALDTDCRTKAGNASNIGLHQSAHFATDYDQFKEACDVADRTRFEPPKPRQPRANGRATEAGKVPICRRFNTGECTGTCRYRHACQTCGGTHSAKSCTAKDKSADKSGEPSAEAR
jgi:hypothetical protein